MVEISGWFIGLGGVGLAVVGFFSGLGQAAGKHFYDRHLAQHAEHIEEVVKKHKPAVRWLITGELK